MTFERDNRTGHDGGWLWRMDISDRELNHRYGRRLIIEPSASQNPSCGAELHVWVEDHKARYHWISESPERPSGPPTWAVDTIEVEGTRHTLSAKHPLEYVIIKALSCGDLHGESASSAVHNLFWLHFVDDDDGLTYFCKHAAKDRGNFYARERLLRYVWYNDRTGNYTVQSAIEDSMKHNACLGERFAQHTIKDRALRDAIEALLLTNEPEEVQHANIRKIVELNATRMDHVIAGIVNATREEHSLLGLRACQRVERDSEFFAAVDAFVLAHPDGRGMIKFLKPHCKPKTSKPVQEDECYE